MTASLLSLSIARTAIRHPLIVGQVTELLKGGSLSTATSKSWTRDMKRSAAGATNFSSMKP
jgi:hypothetical protein